LNCKPLLADAPFLLAISKEFIGFWLDQPSWRKALTKVFFAFSISYFQISTNVDKECGIVCNARPCSVSEIVHNGIYFF
jgi:hypothetical protein